MEQNMPISEIFVLLQSMLESILLWSWYYGDGRLDILVNSLWSVLLACLKVPFDFHEKTFKNG